jgi:thiol:disulfide interchange protein DsbC
MKKILLISSILSAFTISAFANFVEVDSNKTAQLEKTVTLFKNQNVKISKGYFDKDMGIYALKTYVQTPRGKAKVPAFVVEGKDIVIVGAVYDKDGKKLSFPKDVKAIKNGVLFSSKGNEKKLYVVTDPECPFCKRLEKEKGDKLKKLKVHFILYPLNIHPKAKAIVAWIVKSKNEDEAYKRYKSVMKGNKDWIKDLKFDEKTLDADLRKFNNYITKETLTEDETKYLVSKLGDKNAVDKVRAYLKASSAAMDELGARGTPSVYDNNFKSVNISTF